ncbi:MAG: hypothetical protein KDJ77_04665 [Rhodobiaceae bacterium]|nr:hypothetical protein [Rhodobiaceae bacterium]
MTNHTIRKAQTEIRRFAGRARRVADVPGMVRHLHFQRLRERFNSEMWQTAAQAIGAEFAPWRSGFSRVSRDGRMTLVRGGEVMLDSHLTLDLMGNKSLVYALMREKGFPSPAHIRFSAANLAPAERFLEEASGPIVVKPESGTGGGRGVTTGITDVHALRKAVRLAARYDVGLIAEDQFEGSSYRLLFLDGRFIDAVRRDPPMIEGDGRKTIRRLIAEENRRRLAGSPFTALSPITIDRDCRNWLAAHGLSPRHRLSRGVTIPVKQAANENAAAQNRIVRETVHHRTIADCARLVTDLGVTLAGVDILCRDIALPLGPDNGLISEINTTPGLHHHYLVRETDRIAGAAEAVLDHILTTGQGAIRLDGQTIFPRAVFQAARMPKRAAGAG